MRFKLTAPVLAVLALLGMGSSNASALTYDLSLNSAGGQTGTGMFTISGSVSGSGTSTFTAGSNLTALSFTIDNVTFSLSNEQLFNPYVTFSNGVLTNVAYVGSQDGWKLDLGTYGLNYFFLDFLNNQISSGTISNSVSATPLPPGLPLFITGLVALALLGWRKKQKIQAA